MPTYRCTGNLFIEGTMESADYDFEMESDFEPDSLEVLDYMMNVGIIQIFHEDSELVDDEEDEDY